MIDKAVSVIIPAYNAEKYINETVRSVLEYKGEDLEVIVVDDGSTDLTLSICKEIEDSRIRIISINNSGVSVARNVGIMNANGKYCMFLDADDVLLKNTWLEIMSDKPDMDYDFLIFAYQIADEKLNTLRRIYPFDELCITKEKIYRAFATSTNMNYCWGKIYRTAFLKDNDISFLVGLKIGEDILFQMALLQHNPHIKYINKELVAYRQIDTSVMHCFSIGLFDNLVNDLQLRKNCLRRINCTEFDYALMYSDECRNLLSYVKKASKTVSKETIVKILKTEEIDEIITKTRVKCLNLSMGVVVILLRLKMYDFVLMILRKM